MKNIIRVFKMEFYKFRHNRVLFYSLIGALVFVMAVTTITFNRDYKDRMEWEKDNELMFGKVNPVNYSAEERQELAEHYKIEIQNQRQMINLAESKGDYAIADLYRERVSELSFLIETGTIEEDYVKNYVLYNMDYNYYGPSYLFQVSKDIIYIFSVFAVLLGAILFSYEYQSGAVKNLISAPVKRKELLWGKLLFLFSLITALILFYLLYSLIVVANYGFNDAKTLVITIDSCKAVSVYVIFLSKMLALFISFIAAACLAILAGEVFNSHIAALICPLIIYLLSSGAHELLIKYLVKPNINTSAYINYFPFIGLMNYNNGFDINFLAAGLIHIVLIVLSLFFAIQINRKRDF